MLSSAHRVRPRASLFLGDGHSDQLVHVRRGLSVRLVVLLSDVVGNGSEISLVRFLLEKRLLALFHRKMHHVVRHVLCELQRGGTHRIGCDGFDAFAGFNFFFGAS